VAAGRRRGVHVRAVPRAAQPLADVREERQLPVGGRLRANGAGQREPALFRERETLGVAVVRGHVDDR